LILFLGFTLAKYPVWQAVVLAICGAILQTAVLGLIYEVWLRSEVEDATLEKLGTARDVREHGLVALHADASIDWAALLSNARELSIVTHDPQGLFGRADDMILQHAGSGTLKKLVIAVSKENWDDVAPWLSAFVDRWKLKCPAAEVFAARIEASSHFELVATEDRYIILAPSVAPTPHIAATKMLEFKKADKHGMGEWLHQQFLHVQTLNGDIEIGYAPSKPTRRKRAQPSGSQAAPEELT
jgi:hypothetical protein